MASLLLLWANNGKCSPEQMRCTQVNIVPVLSGDTDGDLDLFGTTFTGAQVFVIARPFMPVNGLLYLPIVRLKL